MGDLGSSGRRTYQRHSTAGGCDADGHGAASIMTRGVDEPIQHSVTIDGGHVVVRVSGDKAISADRVQGILQNRARALAKSTEVERGETMQMVVLCLANETYGIVTEYVAEVQPLTHLSPVPCTPAFVKGVINIRGAIYSVIDIRGFFDVGDRPITEMTKVILVGVAGMEVGILADDVKGAMNIPISDIKVSLATYSGAKEEYVEGVTADMLIILNLEALLSDERIIVNEEVA